MELQERSDISAVRTAASVWSDRINRAVEFITAILMALLVLDVWLGVADRYYFRWQLPWPETLARYLMIWVAMLAISSGIARRDHIGLTGFIGILPVALRRGLLILVDVLTLGLFLYLLIYGVPFAISGLDRGAMIFGSNMAPFYAAIPAAALLACVQLLLALLRDLGTQLETPASPERAV